MKKALTAIALVGSLGFLAACQDAATVAHHNIDEAADNFEILRVVTFYNTWTDTNVLQVVGFCSVYDTTSKFQVICKNEDGTFNRRQMGRNSNMTYYLDQVEGVNVSTFQPRVIFRPQTMIPDFDFMGDAQELVNPSNTDG